MTEQDSYAVMPSLAKILLGPGSPACRVAALDRGSAHRRAGASCSGQGWKGGRGKYFTWCAASSSSDNSVFEHLHILTEYSSAEDKLGKNQHSDGKVGKQEVKSGRSCSIRSKVLVKESFPSSWHEKRGFEAGGCDFGLESLTACNVQGGAGASRLQRANVQTPAPPCSY